MKVYVLRSSCSEVLDNCSEKSEKTPRKTSVEEHFFILGNKKQSTMNDSLDIFSSDYLLRKPAIAGNFIKNRLQNRCFPVNIGNKFLRIAFFYRISPVTVFVLLVLQYLKT